MISFGICEGSYVILKDYHLAKAKKLGGGIAMYTLEDPQLRVQESDTTCSYIAIDEFYSIGEEERENPKIEYYLQYIPSTKEGSLKPAIRRADEYLLSSDDSEHVQKQLEVKGITLNSDVEEHEDPFDEVSLIPIPPSVTSTPKKRKREVPLEDNPNLASRWNSAAKLAQELEAFSDKLSTDSGSRESSESLPTTPSKRRRTSSQLQSRNLDNVPVIGWNEDAKLTASMHIARFQPTAPSPEYHQTSLGKEQSLSEITPKHPSNHDNPTSFTRTASTYLPTYTSTFPFPHPLVPLSHISRHRRNTTLSILALIHSISPSLTSAPRLGRKRDLRIVDPSTPKKVLLSIFVEPERFMPEVGSVLLFKSLTTHEWDGGMLNAYPKFCKGVWYVVDPEGCDVKGLREWWRGIYGEEAGDGEGARPKKGNEEKHI